MVALALGALAFSAERSEPGEPSEEELERRLRAIREEIVRLRAELERLSRRERSILGDLERTGTDLKLREAEHRETSMRLEGVSASLGRHDREIASLSHAQEGRRGYLLFRLREAYKRGPESVLRRVLAGREFEDYLRGLRDAIYLSERDARTLDAWRDAEARLAAERAALQEEQVVLETTRRDLDRARVTLRMSRAERSKLLDQVRRDKTMRRDALRELEAASREIGRVADSSPTSAADLDVRRFRGLLEWPAAGEVTAGFGRVVHPRFKTVVPHPGLDIDAREGADFHSVFDGIVVFADWLRGYGLTAIVDHGNGVVSVYAHASVLAAEKGERVARGQSLGKVGDSGSLRGPYLYFEIRENGKPVDPSAWLRPRR